MKERIHTDNEQLNIPLHGVKLMDILERLVEKYGWESSLKFLRKTPWARDKVEQLYIKMSQK